MIRTRRRRLLVAALVSAALAASACGRDSEPPPPEPTVTETTPASGPEGSFPTLSSSATQAQLPPGHPPLEGGPGAIAAPPTGSGAGATGLQWTTPAGWLPEPPANSMRKAQYRVPGPGGDGECVVFYFGPGQGGDPMANASRWAAQFRPPQGKTPQDAMRTSEMRMGDLKVLLVETTGTYLGGQSMSMEPAAEKPGYALLGAIAEGPDANWFFKFTGPERTVEAHRASFEALLKSLRRGS